MRVIEVETYSWLIEQVPCGSAVRGVVMYHCLPFQFGGSTASHRQPFPVPALLELWILHEEPEDYRHIRIAENRDTFHSHQKSSAWRGEDIVPYPLRNTKSESATIQYHVANKDTRPSTNPPSHSPGSSTS